MNESAVLKIIKMFTPIDFDFLNFDRSEVIEGPDDRAEIGFDTYFPIKWLVEDFQFTEEEAKWFVNAVQILYEDEQKEVTET